MNTRTFLLLSAVFLMSVALAMAGVRQSAQFAVRAVDEQSRPLNAVHITARFAGEKTEGDTDTNGFFVVRAEVLSREGGFVTAKDGCYATHAKVLFPSVQDGRCQPWSPVITAVVRRVGSPIPMNVKRVDATIPVLDHFVGYDLMSGDWVAPYGVGKVADLNFRVNKRVASFRDFDSSLEMIVTNNVDGLQETSLSLTKFSDFRLLRQAPLADYGVTNLHWTNSSTNFIRYNDDQSYYFRIRSVTNESGQLTSALYGKIRGYIGFGVRSKDTGAIQFTYYLNPRPNDRNLEFDPKRNLFTNLGEFETVSEP